MALGLIAGSGVAAALPHAWQEALQWHRADAWRTPLAWWSSALIHYGAWHLAANVAAALAVGAWGRAAGLQRRHAVAWLLAWPLSALLLPTDPSTLAHYAGLSALLHAGVAIGCAELIVSGPPGRRWVGVAVGSMLLIKGVWESPWLQASLAQVPVAHWTGPALPGAPAAVQAGHAHGCGIVAGLLGWAVVTMVTRLQWHHPRQP